MKIFIKLLNGKSFDFEVNQSDTIKSIKEKISDKEEIPINYIRLIYFGKELEDNKALIDYGIIIKNDPTIHAVFKIKGFEKISVKTIEGKVLNFDVLPSDTIEIIKLKIKEEEGLDPTQLNLFFNKLLLKNDKTLLDYNFYSETIIKIVPNGILQIENLQGKIIDIEANHSDSIESIKEKIKYKEGSNPIQFHLFFDNKLLKDDKTLEDYDISSESILKMVQKDLFKIESLDGKKIAIEAKTFETIEYIKKKIKEKEKLVQCRCELIFKGKLLEDCKTLDYYNIDETSLIYFKYYKLLEVLLNVNDEREINLTVESKDTIRKVKQKINNIEGILPNRYKLKYNEIDVEDDKTIEDYNITNRNILHLFQIDMIQIQVNKDKKIIINVEYSDTPIRIIKQKIKDKEGILSNEYKLIFKGIKLEDYKTLDDYGINNKSIIILKYYKNFEISIYDNKNIYYIKAGSLDTIKKIKEKIKIINGVPINKYILEFETIKLEDYKTLDDYNIENTKISFYIIYCPLITIFVTTWTGRSFYLDAETSNTISEIKKMLQNKIKINIDSQRLTFRGKTLEDDKTLEYYNVNNYYNLELVFRLSLRLRGGH